MGWCIIIIQEKTGGESKGKILNFSVKLYRKPETTKIFNVFLRCHYYKIYLMREREIMKIK